MRGEAFVKKGKVKEVYLTADGNYCFVFTDSISVFDQVIPTKIEGKGETLNRCSAHWFKEAEKMGILTHYIGRPAPNQMLVKRAGSFPMKGPHEPDYGWANTSKANYQIPLEVISRHNIVGSMYDRLLDGRVKPEELGFPAGTDPKSIKKGAKLPEPFVEVTTKFEKRDKPLPVDEALRIAGIMPVEYNEMKEIVLQLDEEMARQVESRGLIHFDGKKEFALNEHRELMLIDTFGTGDEDRFVLKKEFEEKGKIVEISKEYVRQYYRKIGHHEELERIRAMNDKRKEAREEPLPEPEIPPLPEADAAETSRIYKQLAEMITGEGT